MKTFIFEGISSSGKTSICSNLQHYCEDNRINARYLKEAETIIPLIDNVNIATATEFMETLISAELGECVNIIDRFHISHCFKTSRTLSAYKSVEKSLSNYNPTLIMLRLNEECIFDRIESAAKYKNPDWIKYMIENRGGSIAGVVDFLIGRQRLIEKLFSESSLEKEIIDIEAYDFISPTRRLIDKYL